MKSFFIFCAVAMIGLAASASSARAQAEPALTKADIDKMMVELSNWGRWGKDDQLGAVNLITPAKRKEAAALVKEGISVSLAHDLQTERAADNPNPFGHAMGRLPAPGRGQFVVDTFTITFHGYCHSHLDALCHMFIDGKMYNGFEQSEITEKGAPKLDICNLKNGIFTRGILLDFPALKGVPFLEPGTPIYPADIEAWEKKAGIRVSAGDVIFVRTGRWARREAVGPWPVMTTTAGLHASCARFLKERDVAIIGSDAVSDVMPSGVQGVTQPIHQLTLVCLGVNIFDNLDLEDLAKTAAKYNRWEFLLTTAPMRVEGGTGSPLNPIGTF